jgi:hypothetical protein
MDKTVFYSEEYVIILVKPVCRGPIRQLHPEDDLKRKAETCSCQYLFNIIYIYIL